jgi:EAL domain-containing protein (putative c-di-GMP-specific phosphodiesterase class I)
VKRIIRKDDILARLGGDEFILLLSELSLSEFDAMKMAQEVSKKVHAATKEAYHVEKHVLHVTASIGVTLIDDSMQDKNDILKFADLAMYKAKEAGRDQTCFYEEQMDTDIKKRLIIENDLHTALKSDEFELHYHPIVTCQSAEVVCVEALLRHRKKDGTLIYPDEFIGVAEESGTIVAIGYWVIQEACRQFKFWQDNVDDLKLENIAINISQKQFMQEDFVTRLSTIVSEYDIACSSIELELTESVVIGDVNTAITKMNRLKELGFVLSMDDFGTGYSSLSYLKNLPFDIIKIDRSFMQNILTNSDDAILVTTILNICEQFNLQVIAEGVEKVEQIEFLRSSSCDYYQGHVVTPPLPANEFEIFLH